MSFFVPQKAIGGAHKSMVQITEQYPMLHGATSNLMTNTLLPVLQDGRRNLLETIDDVLAPTGEEHSDTMAALLLLRNEFPASAKVRTLLLPILISRHLPTFSIYLLGL